MPYIRNQAAYDAAIRRNASAAKKKGKCSSCTIVCNCGSSKRKPARKTLSGKPYKKGLGKAPSLKKLYGTTGGALPMKSMSDGDKTLHNSVVAQLDPTAVPRCSASSLLLPRPSQKVSGFARGSYTVASGQVLLAAIGPTFANDSTHFSIYGYIFAASVAGTSNNMVFGTTNPAQGATPYPTDAISAVGLSTATPYSFATLAANDYSTKFVSANLRVRNKSSQNNRGGELLVFQDHFLQMGTRYAPSGNTNAALTVPTMYNTINSSSRTISHPFTTEVNVVLNGSDHIFAGQNGAQPGGWTTAGNVCGYVQPNLSWTQLPFGNTGITTSLVDGMPIAWVMYNNTTSASANITFDYLEHWEVEGNEIEMLHTPSPSNNNAASAISALIASTRAQHSEHPHKSFSEVALHAAKHPAVKSAFKGVENIIGNALKTAVANKADDTSMTAFASLLLA
jgi:hypothetical protein